MEGEGAAKAGGSKFLIITAAVFTGLAAWGIVDSFVFASLAAKVEANAASGH